MPTYDYVCSHCGHRMEVVHAIHGHGPRTCPDCGREATMAKTFAPPAIHFKGSGWAKKDRSATVAPGKSKAAPDTAPAKPASSTVSESPTPPSAGTTGDAGSSKD